ncbi:MAG: hypothetical protein KDE27_21080, partial [Planctomycetes bacterium]|nr:hypothetical protein [Planctomycetota bacterium]
GFAALPHLPALSELSLTWSNADDAALAVLSRLRLERLELQACPRIGRVTIERIARMDSLRVLALGANPHLEADWLGALADLEHLESLDLGMIGSRAFFSGLAPLPQSEPGTGVTDDLLAALTKLPALRALNLDYAGISAEGLMALRALPTLERLSLRGSFAFLDDGESELLLRSFPKLRTVVTDAGERTLR